MKALLTVLVILVVLALIAAAMSVRIIKQYEDGVLFRLNSRSPCHWGSHPGSRPVMG